MSGYRGMTLPETLPNYMIISREDVLALARQIAMQDDGKRLTLKEAAAAYNLDERTILGRIKSGNINGKKSGGVWEIETPAQRAARMNNNN